MSVSETGTVAEAPLLVSTIFKVVFPAQVPALTVKLTWLPD
jgi:hypothetical protein